MNDQYDGMGEFHDLFMTEPWERLRPHLRTAFGPLAPDDVVWDLGAGTGVGTRILGQNTAAQVVAVEPSRTMRSVLLARVADDPTLVSRVSVLAGTVPDAIDGPVSGFVCAHVLGHLAPEVRAATFARLADLLAVDGIGLVTITPESTGGEAPAEEVIEEERSLGRHRYRARYSDAPDGSLLTEYAVLDGDRVLRTVRFSSTWDPPTTAGLRDELADAGIVLEQVADRVGIVRGRRAAG